VHVVAVLVACQERWKLSGRSNDDVESKLSLSVDLSMRSLKVRKAARGNNAKELWYSPQHDYEIDEQGESKQSW